MVHYSSAQQAARFFTGRPHVAVPTQPIGGAAAWRGAAIRALGDYRHQLALAEIEEIERGLAHAMTIDKPTIDLVADDLPLPGLSGRIAQWRTTLTDGRGFVVISGVPVERWSARQAERFFWLLGQHLGVPGLQNPQGDLLGHVTDTGDAATDPLIRLYRTAADIRFHCDGADVVGLLCLAAASRGGASRIASSVTVFNELVQTKPALAARLFAPVRVDYRNEQPAGQLPYWWIQPACFDGKQLRTFYHADYYRSVTRHVGALRDDEQAMLDAYEEIAERADVRLDMQLEPGDIQLLSNHTIIHARTAYEDGAARRHLLRLWLTL